MTTRYMTLAALFAAFTLSALTACAQDEEKSSLVGKPAPDFTLTTLDGKEVKLSSLKDNVVVLDFWATWCPPCRKSLPHLQELSKNEEMAKKGLKVLAVNLREKSDTVEKFVKDGNFSFTVPMDTDGAVAKTYGVQGIPTTVIVGKGGNVQDVFVGFGPGSAEKMDAAINKALGQ